ncbi:MAG: radical SAM protein [Bacillota bacterium]
MERAWRVRQENFPPAIEFDYPNKTKVISTTGTACSLDCAHCGKHYLEGMTPIAEALAEATAEDAKPRSFLISGGCDRTGRVPVLHHRAAIEALKATGRVNFHVGLVDDEEARALAAYADAVSFDFVGDDETIHETFGLDRTVSDYLESYRALRRHTKVLPHICIGLRGGAMSGEERALQILRREGADALVFIVFIPTKGTRYADRTPPPVGAVIETLARARLDFPRTPIFLGCMRPAGRYRVELDQAAVRCGVQKVVIPARPAVQLARDLGLEVSRGEECCVL